MKNYKRIENYVEESNTQSVQWLKWLGFAKAEGDVVITMDADLQDSPDEIPELYNMVINGGFDLVSGWKKKRYDHVVTKNLPSKLFNWAARKTSGVNLNDFNCGLKAYKNMVIKNIEVSGEMHRYIPVLAKNAGFVKIGEKVVQHQARKYGESKFGINRFINGLLEAKRILRITVWTVIRRQHIAISLPLCGKARKASSVHSPTLLYAVKHANLRMC